MIIIIRTDTAMWTNPKAPPRYQIYIHVSCLHNTTAGGSTVTNQAAKQLIPCVKQCATDDRS